MFRLLVLLSLSLGGFSQEVEAWRDMPEENLSSPILFINRENVKASGFIFDFHDKETYFVTARHVLFQDTSISFAKAEDLQIPDNLRHRLTYDTNKKLLIFRGVMSTEERDELINSMPRNKQFGEAIELLYIKSKELRLKSTAATLYAHPLTRTDKEENIVQLALTELLDEGKIKYHPSSDVALVEIATHQDIFDETGKHRRLKFSKGVIRKRGKGIRALRDGEVKLFSDILIGNSVYVFGYPTSVSNTPPLNIKLPLLRKGIVAGKNELLKIIILDCPIYYGNSGGLVMEVETHCEGQKLRAIGLITSLVPFLKDSEGSFENSGYSVAVPMDAVLELLSKE